MTSTSIDATNSRITLLKACELDPRSRLLEAARLAYSSFPDYYRIFGISEREAIDVLASMLTTRNTEEGDNEVALVNRQVAGFIAWYKTKEAPLRQAICLKMLTTRESLSGVMNSLRLHRETVEPIDGDGAYLSRIAVSSDYQGQRLGKLLLERFEAKAREWEKPLAFLHVLKSNHKALGFYKAMGYDWHTDSDRAYRVMSKRLD